MFFVYFKILTWYLIPSLHLGGVVKANSNSSLFSRIKPCVWFKDLEKVTTLISSYLYYLLRSGDLELLLSPQSKYKLSDHHVFAVFAPTLWDSILISITLSLQFQTQNLLQFISIGVLDLCLVACVVCFFSHSLSVFVVKAFSSKWVALKCTSQIH